MISRRSFIKGCCAAAGASAVPGLAYFNPLGGGRGIGHDVIVFLFLRGGIDGLHLVVPMAGPERANYELLRGSLTIPEDRLRPLDAHWGIHPRAGGGPGDPVGAAPKWLHRLWLSGDLAIVQGSGMPSHLSRSHFDAQAWIDLGTPGSKNTPEGWLTRYLATAAGLPTPQLSSAFGFASTLPVSLLGSNDAFTVASAQDFRVDGFHWSWNDSNPDIAGHQGAHHQIQPLWAPGQGALADSGRLAAEALAEMRDLAFDEYQPEGGAVYPSGSFGNQLQNLAQLIKADTGLVAATLDYGGWDTHDGQGMPDPGNPDHYDYYGIRVQGLAEALDAFHTDLSQSSQGNLMNRVTVVMLSEFGRKVSANQSSGSDHGYGNVMMALGGSVNGGQFYGSFPGLDKASLFEFQDLDVTTDYRQVLAEALVRRMGYPASSLEQVFPDLGSYQPMGLFQP
ncbi:DUF1501 domain-containing protein [Wenzhouxiangella marina]|uniref:Uncharacterized protein n=1 Tax=Wenzhouxiangella marina TaxID=1579979 RepID=A0A0K0XWK9_9GAMM|nr:DUF1501 domain-containing protein [Wenzhouxiangella marina]AKS42001.1 hypothetical protein WM2015_1631 [Wenzhouxiangella marina]MBB6086231.1 uncharacterized protein (DUF1501 family) [Wenzhouxiangella marina]